jgi:hypothetical protein
MTGHAEVGLFGVNLTGKAQPVLLKNSPRSRPQRRNGDLTFKQSGQNPRIFASHSRIS